jgi:predicted ATPase
MLSIRSFRASGYRSLRRIEIPVAALTVLSGANGAGKTNLYRALQLLQSAATGTFTREIASGGGMESALWAGRRQSHERPRIELEVELSSTPGGSYVYRLEAGVPIPETAFDLEPHIKEETLTFRHNRRQTVLMKRRGPHLAACDTAGKSHTVATDLMPSETGLAALEAASDFPEQHAVRSTLCDWRFYHEMRTDAGAPLRQPALAVTTRTLASDGSDLAAVFATLAHVRRDMSDVDAAIEEAFPGSRLHVPRPDRTAEFGLSSRDFMSDGGSPRIFTAGELSDGTLRYLALVGALLGHRVPAFIALNEPEASLHPDLIPGLASLIARAAERTQIWVVTHSEPLATLLAEQGALARRLVKRGGATQFDEDAD